MRLADWKEALFQSPIDDPEGYKQEVLSLSHKGLIRYAFVLLGGAAFTLLTRLMLLPHPVLWIEALLFLITAGAMLALSATPWSYPYSRAIALLGGLAAGAIAVSCTMWMARSDPRLEDFVPLQIAFFVLSMVALLPVSALDAFLLTVAISILYTVMHGSAFALDLLFLATLACLASALAAVLHVQRKEHYSAFLKTLLATAELREVQTRLLLSEHTATLGRLSAAVSHELNSPVGALKSSVDTLLLLAARQATSSGDQERLVRLQNDLRKNIQESAQRLTDIVSRMQRFSNLDRAEVQEADLNEIVRDVVSLVEAESEAACRIALYLKPMKPLSCRPAQISAALHTIVSNAAGAVAGGGCVEIHSAETGAGREVVVVDTGKGIDPAAIGEVFSPAFKSAGGRVRAGNWNMFGARQMIRAHGGDIQIESSPGQGTRVRIILTA